MTPERMTDLWLFRGEIHNGELMPQLHDYARAVERATLERVLAVVDDAMARNGLLQNPHTLRMLIEEIAK
jgi:hypothetical protein